MIETDRFVTCNQIRATLGIGRSAVEKILYDELGVRKLCARWIPNNLKIEQKQALVKCCKEIFKTNNNDASNLAFDIITGDETWICYSVDSEIKQVPNRAKVACSSKNAFRSLCSLVVRVMWLL